jgi:hypothetical protein
MRATTADIVWLVLPFALGLAVCAAHGIAELVLQHLELTPYATPWWSKARLAFLDTVMKPICRLIGHRPTNKVCTSPEHNADLSVCTRCGTHFEEPWPSESQGWQTRKESSHV